MEDKVDQINEHFKHNEETAQSDKQALELKLTELTDKI